MQQTHSVTHGKSLGIGRICMLCSKQSIKPECVRLNNFYNEAFRTVLVYSHNIAPHFHNAYLVNLKKKPFTDITPVTWFGKLFHNLTDLTVKETWWSYNVHYFVLHQSVGCVHYGVDKGKVSSLDTAPLTILDRGALQPRKWQLIGTGCSTVAQASGCP